MKILYKFPSRSRPEKFFNSLDNIFINQRHEDFIVWATLDKNDETMNTEEVKERIKRYDRAYPIFGESESKIHAVNRDMELTPEWDILVVMSDDMVFVERGFDTTIIEDMQKYFPDLDGVLHYNDGNQMENVMTMTIYGRKYYDRFNYIYHPSYISLFADNEQTQVAKLLRKYKYMGDDKIIFKHFHPAWGLAKMDAQYIKTESREYWVKDETNYLNRKRNNFDLPGYNP